MRNNKYNMIFAGILFLLVGTVEGLASNCTATPDCASLGFSKDSSKCGGPALKCPWDMSKAVCKEKEVVNVNIGDIVYGDGTVASSLVTGKMPIGVVFDLENRLAVALTNVKKDGAAGNERLYWSNTECDVPNLRNCDSSAEVTYCGIDGRANTDAILASTCNNIEAANAVNAYEPSGCSKDFCKKTKWFLPSMRDLNILYNRKSIVGKTLDLLYNIGAVGFKEWYWSSTEKNSSDAWRMNLSEGRADEAHKRPAGFNYQFVRPVLAF